VRAFRSEGHRALPLCGPRVGAGRVGLATWLQQVAKHPKKTVKLYSSMPLLPQPHSLLKLDCEVNCGIRFDFSSGSVERWLLYLATWSMTISTLFEPRATGFFLYSPSRSPGWRVMPLPSLSRRTVMLIFAGKGEPCIMLFSFPSE